MEQNLDIYGQIDWWNPGHSLVQMAGFKLDYFQSKIGRLDGARVLDVGCGGGIVAEGLARRGALVTGVDISENALETARRHAVMSGLSIRYSLGKAEQLPVEDGAFDAVVCADCLEHVDDLERTVAEAARALRDGGVFCFDTFNRNILSRIAIGWIVEWKLRREYRRLDVAVPGAVVHDWRKFVKPEELAAAMGRHGLALREVRGYVPGKNGFRVAGRPIVSYVGYALKHAG